MIVAIKVELKDCAGSDRFQFNTAEKRGREIADKISRDFDVQHADYEGLLVYGAAVPVDAATAMQLKEKYKR